MSTIMSRKAAEWWWKIEVPKHIIYYYHDGGYHFPGTKPEWKTYTIYDHIRKKVEQQNKNLAIKRRYRHEVPCYICLHKFSEHDTWNIKICTLAFTKYLYLREDEQMYEATRRLHSCGIFPEMVECWEEEFYRLYKTKPKKGEYVRAVKFTRCVVDNYNKLIDVL